MSNYSWLGGIGDWHNPNQWAPEAVPDATAAVNVNGYAVLSANNVDLSQNALYFNRSSTLPVNFTSAGGVLGNVSTVGEGGDVGMLWLNVAVNGTVSSQFGGLDVMMYHDSTNILNGEMLARGGLGTSTINLDATDGQFRLAPGATLDAGTRGTINYSFAPPSAIPYTPFENNGHFLAEGGGVINVTAGHSYYNSFGAVVNTGLVEADGSTINLNANMIQPTNGMTFVHDGGVLNDNGGIPNGSVVVNNGTIAFGLHGPGLVGPFGAQAFAAALELDNSATLAFDHTPISGIQFDAQAQTLTVATGGTNFATFHLSGHDYAASAFSISGDNVLYNIAPAG